MIIYTNHNVFNKNDKFLKKIRLYTFQNEYITSNMEFTFSENFDFMDKSGIDLDSHESDTGIYTFNVMLKK